MSFEQKKTPGEQTRGNPKNCHQGDSSDTHSVADPVDYGEVFRHQLYGIYIVVAEIQAQNGTRRFRRRFYASLDSAQRAVDRARMNDRDAYLYIGRVHIIAGGDRP